MSVIKTNQLQNLSGNANFDFSAGTASLSSLKLNGSSSGFVQLSSPATGGNNTLILPTSNGSASQALITDGNGNLSWASFLPATNPQIVNVGGGDEGDLAVNSLQYRLSVNVGASSTRIIAAFNCSINHTNTNSNDFVMTCSLYDTVTAQDVVLTYAGSSTSGAALGYSTRMTGTLSYNNLTLNRTYTLRLGLYKTQANGPTYPRLMRIDGILV